MCGVLKVKIEIFKYQDTFNHDKGQKSGISGRRLHWIFFFLFSPVDFSPGFCVCNLVRKSLQNVEKIAHFQAEKNVDSCHVSGCHGLFGPKSKIEFSSDIETFKRDGLFQDSGP